MKIPKNYNPSEIEKKWYSFWNNKGYFNSYPDEREPYTVVMPPPNVTGVLHMGHVLNNTIQDVLVRKARMEGKNTCWVPGTDHASIATEAKVVDKLNEEGIEKHEMKREEFLEHAWKWQEEHGGVILEQLKKLGASCDWNRTTFTMDKEYYESVINVFVDLYEKGYIYRGAKMVNWDPHALTAVSDEEVFYKEVNSKLYYVSYNIKEEEQSVKIATTRPETILGDTALCVHPNDERFKNLIGKTAIIPIVEREVPVIADEYVDPEFGTGCLKITPAHDINDHEIGVKHDLEVIEILNNDGTLNENAQFFIGEGRDKARQLVADKLKQKGQLVEEEDMINKVGYSERTNVIIEPKLSMQWFCSMKELAKPALQNVMNENIRFYPSKFKNSYKHWMENIKDWCISRQLWWGHRIPAYYYGEKEDEFVVANSKQEAIEKLKNKLGNVEVSENELTQDEDVLDTWFSSWIWPIAVFNGIKHPDNDELKYYYPTCDLITAPEIIFFWVARMIMFGYENQSEKPFTNVYFTGIVRDKLRRKMSKSLGNSPDPIDLMERYSTDGVRVGMLFSSPAGNDLLFDSNLCEQGRNFGHKVWNALRLIKGWNVEKMETPKENQKGMEWVENELNITLEFTNGQYNDFRVSDALMAIYRFIKEDFCSWYLELIKPMNEVKSIDKDTYDKTIEVFSIAMKILHPFMPFLTEEVWHYLHELEQEDEKPIIISQWPEISEKVNDQLHNEYEEVKEVVTEIRHARKENDISFKEELDLKILNHSTAPEKLEPVFRKLARLRNIEYIDQKIENSYSFLIGKNEYFIPLKETVDTEKQKQELHKELEHVEGFLKGVQKKLNNERFIENAPEEVVEREKKKREDARSKIDLLKKKLERFN
ncbi:MAG: valine--tRNA ligase [Flavobacteriales bacterium]